MVDHQGLERNVKSRKHRERKGFRVIAGWRYTKRYTNYNCVRKEIGNEKSKTEKTLKKALLEKNSKENK
jgi:hypothetical protein